MATPKAPSNFTVMSLRRRGFSTTLTPPTGSVRLTPLAQAVNGTTAPDAGADADFAATATALGVMYATDFNRTYVNRVLVPSRAINTEADLINEALGIGASSWPGGETEAATHLDLETDPAIKVYGAHCVRYNRKDTDTAASGTWAFNPNGVDATPLTRFYIRYEFYIDRDSLAYRYNIEPGFPQQMKILNLGQNGSGQIAITIRRFLGIVSYFTQDASFNNAGDAQIPTPNPWSSSQEWMHNGINNPGTPTTKDQYLAKYGPLDGMVTDEGSGYSYNAGNPFLYNRGLSHGWPDSRIANQINYNGTTVIEVFADWNGGNPSVEIWQGDRNQAPVKICSQIHTAPIGGGGDDWDRFEALFYDTHGLAEPGVRPMIHIWPISLVVSDRPVNFPGGFTLPNNQGGPAGSSTLAGFSSSLVAGASTQSLNDTGFTAANTEDGWVVNWHDRHYYDAVRRKFRFIGKEQANTGGAARHMEYDEAANAWTTSGQLWSGELGHIYGSAAFDVVTGDFYANTLGTGDQVRKWSQGDSLDTWTFATSDGAVALDSIDYASQNKFVSGEGACAWHPNLFGTGDGGLIVCCQRGVAGWRKSTNTWHIIPGMYSTVGDAPTVTYITGLSAAILTNGSTLKAWRITQGPTVTAINDTPVHTGPVSWTTAGGQVGGLLLDDPQQRATCYILEKTQVTTSITRRVWKYNAGAWDVQTYGHPFFSNQTGGEDWSGCAVYGYNLIHALERRGGTLLSRLWKPNT